MTVKFQCPNCHTDLQIVEEYVGKSTNCPKCGKEFIIPGKSTTFSQETENEPLTKGK